MNNQMPMAVWRAGMDKIEAAARAVDMPLRLDNANALPTYPQQKQQEAASFLKDKGRRDHTLNPTSRGPTNGVQFTPISSSPVTRRVNHGASPCSRQVGIAKSEALRRRRLSDARKLRSLSRVRRVAPRLSSAAVICNKSVS